MTYHIDFKPTEDVLFNQLNKRHRKVVKRLSKRITAQELIDQA